MTGQAEELYMFLKNRSVSEDCISKLARDKIDPRVIEFMDDDMLATYIPIYGDRIAVRRFCADHRRGGSQESKKQSLLKKLRRKMGIDPGSEDSDEETETLSLKRGKHHLRNNKMAEKTTRKIELGWIHEGKQLRTKNGGGTRKIDLPKDAKKADILCHARELFFPNGQSKKGRWEEFSHDILDYKEECVMDENVTLREFYSLLKMGVLRFYLCTKSFDSEATQKTTDAQVETDEIDDNVVDVSMSSHSSEITVGPFLGEPSQWQFDDTLPVFSGNDRDAVLIATSPSSKCPLNQPTTETCSTSHSALVTTPTSRNAEASTSSYNTPSTNMPFTYSFFGPSTTNTQHSTPCLLEPSTSNTPQPTMSYSSGPSSLTTEPTTYNNLQRRDFEIVSVHLKLHRSKLLDEMIIQFKDPQLVNCPLKFSFIDEKGSDADGVSRDVYSAFWTEFLDHAAEGQEMRVPLLSPKRKEEEWKSVGRILIKGFQDHQYFPSRLCPAFTVALVFGEHSVSSDLLFESLLLYVSQQERDILQKALKEDLDGEEQEELLDLLERMSERSIPKRENLKATLISVAHKHIIQQPIYALDKMSEVASNVLKNTFIKPTDIQKLYEDIKPTTRKVLKLLDASPTTEAERMSLRYLQQYIRGLEQTGLRKLLRFVTGSDVLCVDKIEVIFTSVDGLARRPVAHTCGPVLELPWTYLSYPELRVELEGILASNSCYVMDIV